jgi:hypothetical protein
MEHVAMDGYVLDDIRLSQPTTQMSLLPLGRQCAMLFGRPRRET